MALLSRARHMGKITVSRNAADAERKTLIVTRKRNSAEMEPVDSKKGKAENAPKGIILVKGAPPAYTGSFHPTPLWN